MVPSGLGVKYYALRNGPYIIILYFCKEYLSVYTHKKTEVTFRNTHLIFSNHY